MKAWTKAIGIGIAVAAVGFVILTAAAVLIVTQPWVSANSGSEQPSPVDSKRLETDTRKLAEDFVPRDWVHTENLDRAAAYIRAEFEKTGAAVQDQVYDMEGRTYRNVIARFGPDSKDPVIVGAHYDAFSELPGADDNASGVAGLIELARLLSRTRLQTRVELVAFTLEEPKTRDGDGLFRSEYGGSARHVRLLREHGVRPRIFIDLEMIGYFSDQTGSQDYPLRFLRWLYPSRGDFVAIVGRIGQGNAVRRVKAAMRGASKLPVYSMSAHEVIEGVDWSDHANYWKAGYAAVMITDTAPNRNRNYHTAGDTPDRLDYGRMAMVVQGVYTAVLDFARQSNRLKD